MAGITNEGGDFTMVDQMNENNLMLLKQVLKKGRAYEVRQKLRRVKVLQNKKGTDEQKTSNERKVKRILLAVEKLREFTPDQLVAACVKAITDARNKELSIDQYITSDDFDESLNDPVILSLITSKMVFKYVAELVLLPANSFLPKRSLLTSPVARPEKKLPYKISSGDKSVKKKIPKSHPVMQSKDIGGHRVKVDVDAMSERLTPVAVCDQEKDDFFITKPEENTPHLPYKLVKNVQHKKIQRTGTTTLKTTYIYKKKRHSQELESSFVGLKGSNKYRLKSMSSKSLEKKNRMGQRARQLLSKLKYGKEPFQKDNCNGYQMFKEEDQASPIKEKASREGRLNKSVHTRNKKQKLDNKDTHKATNLLMEKIEGKTEKLKRAIDPVPHPSWEAKRREKSAQAIQKFQGTKITFDD